MWKFNWPKEIVWVGPQYDQFKEYIEKLEALQVSLTFQKLTGYFGSHLLSEIANPHEPDRISRIAGVVRAAFGYRKTVKTKLINRSNGRFA